jgi:hypothetical protein
MALATSGRRASGQDSPQGGDRSASAGAGEVVVLPSTCSALPGSADAWVALLRVELAADRIEVRSAEAAAPSSAAPRVAMEAVPCEGSAVSATLTFSSGAVQRTRTVALGNTEPVARPRVLAMAMAELVRSGIGAAKVPAAAVPAQLDVRVRLEIAPPARAEPPATPATEPAAAFFLAGETRAFVQGAGGLFGARAGAQVALAPWLAWVADAGVSASSAHDPLGDVDGTIATLGAGLLGTGGAGDVRLGVGPRVEAGIGAFQGHATAPLATASRATTALALFALSSAASFPIRGRLSGWLGLDAGTSLYGFSGRADARHVSDFVGPMVSARIGLLWR